jgi:hypothetical protein
LSNIAAPVPVCVICDQETNTPQVNPCGKESDNINSTLKSHIIDASLKRRARLLITNSSIPRQIQSLIRYETADAQAKALEE